MASDEMTTDGSTKGGVRGRIDRLCQEYLMKAQALRITSEILAAEDARLAVERAPKKFLQAVNLRASANGAGVDAPHKPRKNRPRSTTATRFDQIRAHLTTHPGASTTDIAAAIGLAPNTTRKLVEQIATLARPVKPRQLMHWVLPGAPTRAAAPLVDSRGRVRKTRTKRAPKKSRAERAAEIAAYLQQHPDGAYATDIATAMGVQVNMIRKIAPDVAKAQPRAFPKAPILWVLKKQKA